MRRAVFYAAAIWLILILAGVAGSADFAEEQREEARYCANVRAGVWPDFKHWGAKCWGGDNVQAAQ